MKTTSEKLLGVFLQLGPSHQRELYTRLLSDYFTTSIEKRIYKNIGDLLTEGKPIDILTLTLKFKEQGELEKGLPAYISGLTTDVIPYTSTFNTDTLIYELEANRIFKEAVAFNNKLANILDYDVFTIEKYNDLINSAKELTAKIGKKELSNVDTIFNIIENHYKAKDGQVVGLDLTYSQLRRVILLEPCDVMLIGARPAMGKTAYAVNTAVRLALAGKRVLYFSLEMSKEQILRRVLANITGIDSNKIKYGLCNDNEIDAIYKAQALEALNNLIVVEGSKSINEISTLVSKYKGAEGLDVFIVDYIQKIQAKTNRGRYEAVTEISNGVKLITMGAGVPCIALAQLSRDSSKLGKRPSLPDLKESGELEQDASVVAFLHRPEYYGETETYNGLDATNALEFIIAKNRDGELGIYDFNVDLSTSKFT